MSKQVYTLKLTPEADSANFLTQGAGSNYECIDAFPNMPRVFLFNLTQEEADYLQNLQEVEIVFTDELPEDDSPRTYGSATYTTSNREVRSVQYHNLLPGSGADYISDNYHHQTGIIPDNSSGDPTLPDGIDAFANLFLDTATNVTGKHVDIVIVEVMSGNDDANATNSDDMRTHIDMASAEDATDTTNRLTAIDWSDYNSGVDLAENNRVTNPTANFINNHGSGSVSVAAGKYCGAASSSNIYTIKLTGQSQAQVFSAIKTFHERKNDPNHADWRGRPTATVVSNSWGYSVQKYDAVVPIEQVEEIQTSATAISSLWTTSATRPVAGWGTDLTPFINAGIVPRIASIDGTDQWVIVKSSSGLTSSHSWYTIGTSFDYSNTEGLYVFQSAGNTSSQAAKQSDPLCQSRVRVAENSYYATKPLGATSLSAWRTVDDDGNLIASQQITTSGGQWWYPNKAYGAGSTEIITVGAAQHRTAEGHRAPNGFSTRGSSVDIFAGGTYTWSAGYSTHIMTDGGRWGWYGGTSCACPVAAGIAACFLQDYYDKYSKYPTQEKLLQILKKNAKPSMQENDDNYWSQYNQDIIPFSWSNVTYEADTIDRSIIASGILHGSGAMLELQGLPNGGPKRFDMIDTTTDRVFLPYGIRMGNGLQITEPRGRTENKRPASGQTYPRRKVRIGS